MLTLCSVRASTPSHWQPSEWKRLRTLSVRSELRDIVAIDKMSEFLMTFHQTYVQDVTVYFLVGSPNAVFSSQRGLLSAFYVRPLDVGYIDACHKLEAALSKFSLQHLSFEISSDHRPRRRLWTRELGSLFPESRNRGRLTVSCQRSAPIFPCVMLR